MKTRRISRQTPAVETIATQNRPRAEVIRTVVAVTLALALIGTGAIALPSFAPITPAEDVYEPVVAQLEPETLADIESVHESAGMLERRPRKSLAPFPRSPPAPRKPPGRH